jgi:hypothetical protein
MGQPKPLLSSRGNTMFASTRVGISSDFRPTKTIDFEGKLAKAIQSPRKSTANHVTLGGHCITNIIGRAGGNVEVKYNIRTEQGSKHSLELAAPEA